MNLSNLLGYRTPQIESKKIQVRDLCFTFDNGTVRNITYGNREIISQIYFAVRDENWGTLAYSISDVAYHSDSIQFQATVSIQSINYQIEVKIFFTNDQLQYCFEGNSRSDFLSNRIGLCVLIPSRYQNHPCEVFHTNGQIEKGKFPDLISPDQPFTDILGVSWRFSDDCLASLSLDGDVFEMEDQRNWTDSSYKIYSRPLNLPFPFPVKTGETIRQGVTLDLSSKPQPEANLKPAERLITFDLSRSFALPALGITVDRVLSQEQLALLTNLSLSYLRVDYFPEQEQSQLILNALIRNVVDSLQKILLCIYFDPDHLQAQVEQMQRHLRTFEESMLVRFEIAIFLRGVAVPENQLLSFIIEKLHNYPGKIGSGSDAYFTQLNRSLLNAAMLDFVIYAVNPQVHAFDNESLMSTFGGQIDTVTSAKRIAGEKPVYVSPVTLKMRWNPDKKVDSNPDFSEPEPDERQWTLFCAAWTFGSIVAMIRAQVDLATYFLFAGDRGIVPDMDSETSSIFPGQKIYPVYLVFKILEFFQGWDVYLPDELNSDYSAILFRKDAKDIMVICNFQPYEITHGIHSDMTIKKTNMIDLNSLEEWLRHPDSFAVVPDDLPGDIHYENSIKLGPYSIGIVFLR